MSFQAMTWAVDHDLPAMQKIVLLMMANHYDDAECCCYVSHNLLAKECGMDKRSIIRQIDKLIKAKLIESIKTKECGGINKYILNMCDVIGSKDDIVTKDKTKLSCKKKKISYSKTG